MELVTAICPECEREIEVNTAEEVDFCKHCGKPYSVKEAVELYAENKRYNEAAKKPSDEAIKKFNAVLAQDYKLAQKYLEDIIQKEYPPECGRLLRIPEPGFRCYRAPIRLYDTFNYYKEKDINDAENDLQTINWVNPHIAEMYYKIFCAHINALYKKEDNNNYSGELAFLKLRLRDTRKKLIWAGITECLADICKTVSGYESLFKQDYDDKYVCDLVIEVEKLLSSKTYKNGIWISNKELLKQNGNPEGDNALDGLNRLLSAAGKKKLEERRAAEEKRRKEEVRAMELKIKKEAEQKAFSEELHFWGDYIALLKAGKAKKALFMLDKNKKSSKTGELNKFKVGLFSVKYTGDVSALNALTLLDLATSKDIDDCGPENSSTTSSKS